MGSTDLGKIQITKNKLLIVEGKDEERFLEPYFDIISISDIQILPIGGKTFLKDTLKALAIDPNLISFVEILGIISDADINATSTFQSVCSSLRNARLPVPNNPLIASGTNPNVTILIMPPGSTSGNFEDLCFQAVRNDPAVPCVASFFLV